MTTRPWSDDARPAIASGPGPTAIVDGDRVQGASAVRDQRARLVVLDLTGSVALSGEVAGHVVQTIRAARLLGARTVVTGISGGLAAALVGHGQVDLDELTTAGDLRGGIEYALRLAAEGPRLPPG